MNQKAIVETEKVDEETGEIETKEDQNLLAMAIKNGASVDTLERLMVVRRELQAERARNAFHAALAGFQADCPVIQKRKSVMNKGGVTVRYRYAPLSDIIQQVQAPLARHHLTHREDSTIENIGDETFVTAICVITHAEGHSETATFKVPIDKEAHMNLPQQFASAHTFARRYAFCAVLGILTGDDDDDAQTAAPSTPAQKSAPPPAPEPARPVGEDVKADIMEMERLGQTVIPFGNEIKGKTFDEVDEDAFLKFAKWVEENYDRNPRFKADVLRFAELLRGDDEGFDSPDEEIPI